MSKEPKANGRLCLRITDEMMENLQEIAKKERKLVTEVARDAIRAFFGEEASEHHSIDEGEDEDA